jgi:hypothetical protein
MAFVKEDGTGLANSNAYVDADFVDDYANDRGGDAIATHAAWFDLGTSEKEAAIIRATDYIDGGRYRFVGIRKLTSQALEWPRVDARYTDDDRSALEVPIEVQKACAELALQAADGSALAPNPEYDDSGRFVEALAERVGPIETSTRYSQAGAPTNFRKYPRVDKILRFLVIGGRELLRA